MTIRRFRVRSDMAIQLALLLILLSLLQPLASADEVLINDGSRLIGEVVRHDTGVLKLKTSFAGTLEIDWAEVREVIFSEPVTVLLADDQTLEIKALSREGDQFVLYPVTSELPRSSSIARLTRPVRLCPWPNSQDSGAKAFTCDPST